MAFTIYPFIIATKDEKKKEYLMNHESIHLKQQKEMWVLPFFPIYWLCSVYCLLRYWDVNRMYRLNPFEAEAFANETDLNYLKRRKPFSWIWKNKVTVDWIEQEKKIKQPITNKIGATILIFAFSGMIGLIVMAILK
jgi:hypothetical protein